MRMKRGKRSEIPRSSTYIHTYQFTLSPMLGEGGGGSGEREKSTTYKALRGSIYRTETEVGCENLPHDLRLEPHVWLRAADLDVPAHG